MGTLRLSLLFILLAAFSTVHAFERKSLGGAKNIGRFNSRIASTSSGVRVDWTEAEAHARWLTSRKPTRRTTAERRQVSEQPTRRTTAERRQVSEQPTRRTTAERRQVSDTPSESPASLAAQDATTGTPIGNLVFSGSDWTISSTEEGATISYGGSLAVRATRDAQRLVYASPEASYPYNYFGVGQCNIGSPTDIGPGSSNVLCLVNSASATRSGVLPTLIKNNLDTSGSSYVETDIWTLDASTQIAAPVWINPDGRSVPAYVVYAVNNPGLVFITGDVAATAALYGVEFRKIDLKYTNLN